MEKSSEKKEESEAIGELAEALRKEQAKCKEYLTTLRYLQADFENYKKRIEKEMLETTQRSNERLVLNLLSVMDDFERAIEVGKISDKAKALLEGVEMIYKKIRTILEREGLETIDALGKPFDPHTHEFLAKVPTKDEEEGTIVEETRKGYVFKGKVIRPSVVKIACKEEESEEK